MSTDLDFYKWFETIAVKLGYREISFRKIFEYLNVKIIKLHRYEFFGLKLGNLKSGKYKKVKINKIKKMLNI